MGLIEENLEERKPPSSTTASTASSRPPPKKLSTRPPSRRQSKASSSSKLRPWANSLCGSLVGGFLLVFVFVALLSPIGAEAEGDNDILTEAVMDTEPAREAISNPSLAQSWAQVLSATVTSYAIIIVSEIGDKTFFIAAILAMNRGAWVTFGGAGGALVVMTGLSSCVGRVLPAVLDPAYTHVASIFLFVFFGLKLLWEGHQMESVPGGVMSEFREIEHELASNGVKKEFPSNDDIEKGIEMTQEVSGGDEVSRPVGRCIRSTWATQFFFRLLKCPTFCWSSAFIEAFSLTFTAEWGDRSQIATFALGASKNIWGVNAGAITGHLTCTALAVLGGRFLAKRISEKVITIAGGIVFLFFAFAGWLFEHYHHSADPASAVSGDVPLVPTE